MLRWAWGGVGMLTYIVCSRYRFWGVYHNNGCHTSVDTVFDNGNDKVHHHGDNNQPIISYVGHYWMEMGKRVVSWPVEKTAQVYMHNDHWNWQGKKRSGFRVEGLPNARKMTFFERFLLWDGYETLKGLSFLTMVMRLHARCRTRRDVFDVIIWYCAGPWTGNSQWACGMYKPYKASEKGTEAALKRLQIIFAEGHAEQAHALERLPPAGSSPAGRAGPWCIWQALPWHLPGAASSCQSPCPWFLPNFWVGDFGWFFAAPAPAYIEHPRLFSVQRHILSRVRAHPRQRPRDFSPWSGLWCLCPGISVPGPTNCASNGVLAQQHDRPFRSQRWELDGWPISLPENDWFWYGGGGQCPAHRSQNDHSPLLSSWDHAYQQASGSIPRLWPSCRHVEFWGKFVLSLDTQGTRGQVVASSSKRFMEIWSLTQTNVYKWSFTFPVMLYIYTYTYIYVYLHTHT